MLSAPFSDACSASARQVHARCLVLVHRACRPWLMKQIMNSEPAELMRTCALQASTPHSFLQVSLTNSMQSLTGIQKLT